MAVLAVAALALTPLAALSATAVTTGGDGAVSVDTPYVKANARPITLTDAISVCGTNLRQQNEPTSAVDPTTPNVITSGSNDYCTVQLAGGTWAGFYRSTNSGQTALDERVAMLLDLAGLSGVSQKIGGYSRGMKQRLGVAQALVNAPKLLLLDEPTSALDPMGRKDVLEMLASLRGRTTVFFSTHILADVERVCDTVAILDDGHVVAHAPIEELKARYGVQKVVVEVTGGADELTREIGRQGWATAISRGSNGSIEVTVADVDKAQREIPVMVAARRLGLSRLEAGEMGLEEVFVELVGAHQR